MPPFRSVEAGALALAMMNPFHKLGLARNPFGSVSDDEWAQLAVLPDAVLAALHSNAHLLFLGEKGRGKSTLLRALCEQLCWRERCHYERIPPWRFRFHTDLALLDSFALDEAQRLNPLAWGRLVWRTRNGLRLLIASHHNHAPWLRLMGLRVQVFSVADFATPQHIEKVLQARLEFFALEGEARVRFSEDAILWLWDHFQDDLRAQFHYLYEVLQRLDHPMTLDAAALQSFADSHTL